LLVGVQDHVQPIKLMTGSRFRWTVAGRPPSPFTTTKARVSHPSRSCEEWDINCPHSHANGPQPLQGRGRVAHPDGRPDRICNLCSVGIAGIELSAYAACLLTLG
jgi:hypothetical protein